MGALAKWILSGFEGSLDEYTNDTKEEFFKGLAFLMIIMILIGAVLTIIENILK